MLLSQIFGDQPHVEIKGLCIDSRKAKEGDMFFCMQGLETDGHKYAESACKAGAVAVVHSHEIKKQQGVCYIKVEDVNRELNRVCDLFTDHASRRLTVFGVTGTNGKTTTTSIIRDVYSHMKPCGYMGTIAFRYGNVSKPCSLTTPDAIEIHSNLKEMADHGMEAVSMEVSSHGLDMGRVDSVDFDVAIFTNLTYEHLDYHKTMEGYFRAKQLLFKNMKKEGVAVLNAEEPSFEELAKCVSCRYVSYAIDADADYRAENLNISTTGSKFILVYRGNRYEIETNLVARYNIQNLLAAIAGMNQAGMSIEEMIPYLKDISQVDGRMEIIDMGQDFNVVVDYAHTPDGYEKMFEFAETVAHGRNIYCVFGAPGKRDKVKRRVLGRIAGSHCKTVFLTEEDSRDETPESIAMEIMEGVEKGNAVYIENRYEAIKAAVSAAETGDCVFVLGKGDETYLQHGEKKFEWMGDDEAARRALKEVMNNQR